MLLVFYAHIRFTYFFSQLHLLLFSLCPIIRILYQTAKTKQKIEFTYLLSVPLYYLGLVFLI